MELDIAVCDDCESDLCSLAELLKSACGRLGITPHIDLFLSGEKFIAANSERSYDVVFMDIYLDGISGIDAVKKIRGNCRFVFTTVSTDHAIEAFSLNAAHYLIKPISEEAAAEAVRRCIPEKNAKNTQKLSIKTGTKTVLLPMNEIVFVEVADKVCTIHTQSGVHTVLMPLNALFEMLDKNVFIRAQQSYAVNMNYIDSFYFDHIILHGGMKINLSRNSRTELKEQYQKFLFRMARGESV